MADFLQVRHALLAQHEHAQDLEARGVGKRVKNLRRAVDHVVVGEVRTQGVVVRDLAPAVGRHVSFCHAAPFGLPATSPRGHLAWAGRACWAGVTLV